MARRFPKITATSTLPRIVEFLGIADHGPCDDGEPSAYCPHCGSGGRYIHQFRCEDGTTRGAMSGCVQLFPISPIAKLQAELCEREADLQKRFGKDAKLNSWDQKAREAITAFYAGTLTEAQALQAVQFQMRAKASFRQQKYGKRRW